jgi:glycosyltransferase involved in cell wall biosynthesis
VKLLFAKHSLVWPRSSGHDVHAYYMMKACAALGHDVSLATTGDPSSQAIAGLPLRAQFRLDESGGNGAVPPSASWLQRRFRSFYGIPDARLASLARAAERSQADAVIVVGLDGLPYFPALSGRLRVWYAADEWVLHHLSQLRFRDPAFRANVRDAAVKGLYERAHGGIVDRVWVVSEPERRAMRAVSGVRHVDVLPNGVDNEYFRPGSEHPQDHSAVFWGRLDFGPNIQALEWFVRRVWPSIRQDTPDARFTIIGFQPSEAVRRLAGRDGIELLPDLQDLRSAVRSRSVVVLPFVSGGGIKNKLLEAAALGMPIVCTDVATQGLRAIASSSLVVTRTPEEMAREITAIWRDPARRGQLASAVRSWVTEHHTWTATARHAMDALEQSLSQRPR